VAQAAIAVLATFVLTRILSNLQICREAAIGSTGLSAADVIRFLGNALVLIFIWVLAWRVAAQLPEGRPLGRLFHDGLRPLAALALLASLFALLHPLLSGRMATVLSWLLVLPLVGAAAWLGMVLYENADALVFTAAASTRRLHAAAERRERTCDHCHAPVSPGARFCSECGNALTDPTGGAEPAKERAGAIRSSTTQPDVTGR